MATLSNNFEFSTNGTNITTTNSASGGNAFTAVSTNAPQISTAQRHSGTRSTRFRINNYSWVEYGSSFANFGQTAYGRVYFRFNTMTATPSGSRAYMSLVMVTGNGDRWQAEIFLPNNSSAEFHLWHFDKAANSWGEIGNTVIAGIGAGSWYRLEMMASRGTNPDCEARFAFYDPDSPNADFIITGSATQTAASTWTSCFIDGDNWETTESMWGDDFAVSDVTWPGPTTPSTSNRSGWGVLM